jgi:3-isopropylmalate dehydrogenase
MGSNTLLFLVGDGIGHEIAQETLKIIDAISDITQHKFNIDHDYIGGCSYDAYGTPCSDAVLNKARDADAVLLGCVGGYKWDNIPFEYKPERGLLRLRKELDLFANLRPALCFDALADSSSLKPDIISGLDIMIVRELTSGVYFGEPRGITGDSGHKIAVDTQRYTQAEIERVAHSAFDLARKRGKKVTSCEKANVMQTGILWREVVTQIHAKYYTDVELSHMYADNAAMQLVRSPKQFDVILTDNLFGDILSDVAAMLTGSLGMLPSASLGMADKNNKIPALYEPVHGSAPDIAGQNKANPIAMILSFGMCLKYSLNMPTESAWISAAIEQVLAKNMRTPDIANNMSKIITTQEMGDLIAHEIRHIAG